MSLTAQRFRVACQCAAGVEVGPGQAGGRVTCPACGRELEVPRLRELATFAVTDGAPGRRRWRPCQAWFLLGTAVALTAATAAGLVGGGWFVQPARLPGPDAIRAAIEATDAVTVYRAWEAMRSSGIDRGALPEEARLKRAAGIAGRIAGLLWAIAGLGGITAVGAGIGWLAGGRTPGGEADSPAGGPAPNPASGSPAA